MLTGRHGEADGPGRRQTGPVTARDDGAKALRSFIYPVLVCLTAYHQTCRGDDERGAVDQVEPLPYSLSGSRCFGPRPSTCFMFPRPGVGSAFGGLLEPWRPLLGRAFLGAESYRRTSGTSSGLPCAKFSLPCST